MSLQDLLIQQEIINDLKAKLAIAVEALESLAFQMKKNSGYKCDWEDDIREALAKIKA